MGTSTFSGPIQSGTVREGASANVGQAVLQQTAAITFAHTSAATLGIILPAGSHIIDILVDVETVWNSATSDDIMVGDSADPDKFAGSTTDGDLQVAGQLRMSTTAAQSASRKDIGTADVELYATVTGVGTAASAGAATVTVIYAQD
jgi:hypothetical protein